MIRCLNHLLPQCQCMLLYHFTTFSTSIAWGSVFKLSNLYKGRGIVLDTYATKSEYSAVCLTGFPRAGQSPEGLDIIIASLLYCLIHYYVNGNSSSSAITNVILPRNNTTYLQCLLGRWKEHGGAKKKKHQKFLSMGRVHPEIGARGGEARCPKIRGRSRKRGPSWCMKICVWKMFGLATPIF